MRLGWRDWGCPPYGQGGRRAWDGRREDCPLLLPQPSPTRQEKEAWIHAKYVEKKFLTKLPEIRGRKGGWGPPRGQPPVPPKPGTIRPQPGSFRPKPGIGLAGHLLSACRVLSTVPSLVGRHRVWGPRLPLEPVMGGHSPLVFRGKSFGDYGEGWEGPWGWEEASRAM